MTPLEAFALFALGIGGVFYLMRNRDAADREPDATLEGTAHADGPAANTLSSGVEGAGGAAWWFTEPAAHSRGQDGTRVLVRFERRKQERVIVHRAGE